MRIEDATDFGYVSWRLADRFGDAPAVADDRLQLSHRELDRRAEAFAAQLDDLGFGAGDVLAVMLPNRAELVIAIHAAWRLGGTVTPVNPAFTATEAGHQIRDSGASIVVTVGPEAPMDGLVAVPVDTIAAEASHPVEPVAVDPGAIALLIYTSGSTGRPKGVMLDHANVEAMSRSMADHLSLTADDHCLLILPLFHVNAIMVSTLAPLRSGGRVTIVGSFSPATFFDRVAELRPTYFSAVPTIYALLAALPDDVQPDTSSLRFVICGAAPVTKELLEVSERRFGFVMVEGYGLTEGTCASACNPVEGVRKLGTVGPALAGQRIVVTDDDGNPLPPGQPGEVRIAGPTVMRGYLNDPDATDETIVDGWLRTGDVGRLDHDGYLSIVDRVKDMIIRGGENIYPKEIEAVIGEVEGVLEVAVVGRPDPVLGEVPAAHVVAYPDSGLTAETVLEHCRRHLTRVKVPTEVRIVAALPKNPIGKIDKPTLRRLSADDTAD